MQSSCNLIFSPFLYSSFILSLFFLLFREPFVSINCSVQALNFLHWNCCFMFKGKASRSLTYSSSWRNIHSPLYKPHCRNTHLLPHFPLQIYFLQHAPPRSTPLSLSPWHSGLSASGSQWTNLCKGIPLCRMETAISTKCLSYYRMCYKGVQEKGMILECWCTKANYLLRCKEFVSCSHIVSFHTFLLSHYCSKGINTYKWTRICMCVSV